MERGERKGDGWMDREFAVPSRSPPPLLRSALTAASGSLPLHSTVHMRERHSFTTPSASPSPLSPGERKGILQRCSQCRRSLSTFASFSQKKSFLFLPPEKRCGNRQMSFGYHFQKNRIPSLGESGIGCKSFFFSARKSCNFQLRREIDGGGSEMEARGGEEG